jgi:hypothetical protein
MKAYLSCFFSFSLFYFKRATNQQNKKRQSQNYFSPFLSTSGSHLSLGQRNFTNRNRLAVNSYLLFTFFMVVTKQMPPIRGVTKRFVTQCSCKKKQKRGERKKRPPPSNPTSVHFGLDKTRFHQHIQPTNRMAHASYT